MSIIGASMPALVSGLTLSIVTVLAAFVWSQLKGFRKEHKTLLDAMKNNTKANIVNTYERASERGYITSIELDSVNRMADSYFDLGGNHYIKALVCRCNDDLEIKGSLPNE